MEDQGSKQQKVGNVLSYFTSDANDIMFWLISSSDGML